MSVRDRIHAMFALDADGERKLNARLDAYRVEVLAEVTVWLVKKAREFRSMGGAMRAAQAEAVAALASKVERGAVRPGNLRNADPEKATDTLLARYDDDLYAKATGRLRDFTPVWTTSDGSDVPATELRCVLCGGLVQGVGVKTLLDLNALAASHDCQNTRKDGRQ